MVGDLFHEATMFDDKLKTLIAEAKDSANTMPYHLLVDGHVMRMFRTYEEAVSYIVNKVPLIQRYRVSVVLSKTNLAQIRASKTKE